MLRSGIGVTSVVSCCHVFSEKSRDPSASRPRPSCTIIHFAMSVALELMPPAGFVLSLSKGCIGRTFVDGRVRRRDVASSAAAE